MMVLEQVIRGDWYDLTEHSASLFDLQDFFGFPKPFLESCLSDLQSSVEQGIVEYKRNIFARVHEFISSLKYDSKGLEFLDSHRQILSSLLYCIQCQKLMVSGVIRARNRVIEGEREGDAGDIKTIVEDLNERIKKDQALRMNTNVKNIFLQVQMYKTELAEMKRLVPTIPKDKQAGFAQNYKNRFNELEQKVQQNYLAFLDEAEPVKKEVPDSIWQFDLKALEPVYTKQARLISKTRSMYKWSVEEGYKTREHLFQILPVREDLKSLLGLELKTIEGIEAVSGGTGLLADFGREFARILEKQLSSHY